MGEEVLEKLGHYHIRVRKGDWEVEVTAPDKDFVLDESDRLIKQLGIENNHLPERGMVEGAITYQVEHGQSRNLKPETLNEFIRQFKLSTHLERILVIGYWFEIKQGNPSFTIDDILTKYKEIREVPPANIRRDIGTLQGRGLLLSAGKQEGTAFSLTNSGLKEIEAKLPK